MVFVNRTSRLGGEAFRPLWLSRAGPPLHHAPSGCWRGLRRRETWRQSSHSAQSRKQRRLSRSDRHLQGKARAEGDLLASLNLDRLTGRRIAAHASSPIPYAQNSKTGNLHLFALLKMLPNHFGELFQHLPTLLLGEFMLLRQRISQMLGGDR